MLAQGGAAKGLGPLALGWEQGMGTCLQSAAQLCGAEADPQWQLPGQACPGHALPGGPESSVARTTISPPLLLSLPVETAHTGPGREPSEPTLARPEVCVSLSGPLGRREDGGTDSSGFSSSPSGDSLALTSTGGQLGCKPLEWGLFGPLGPL